MVKNLILVRHAEATEGGAGVKDIERELTAKGHRDAPRIGRYFYENQILPDMILSSSAQRARSTAELMAEQLKYELNQISYVDELYNASVRTLLSTINQGDDAWSILVLVGHNPAISYLSEYLSGEPIGSMDPASYVQIEFEADSWQEVSQNSGRFIIYQTPENTIF